MLTDVQIRKAKPAEKPFKLTDGGGLHLYITPAGGKLWRLRYEFRGKEKLLSFGPYPDLSLSDAREARTEDIARTQNIQNIAEHCGDSALLAGLRGAVE